MAKPVGLTVLKLKALEARAKPYEVRDPAIIGGYVVVWPTRPNFLSGNSQGAHQRSFVTPGATIHPHYHRPAHDRRLASPRRGGAWITRKRALFRS